MNTLQILNENSVFRTAQKIDGMNAQELPALFAKVSACLHDEVHAKLNGVVKSSQFIKAVLDIISGRLKDNELDISGEFDFNSFNSVLTLTEFIEHFLSTDWLLFQNNSDTHQFYYLESSLTMVEYNQGRVTFKKFDNKEEFWVNVSCVMLRKTY